ncbi:MAG: hypothetical protein LBQ24_03300 [Candidatus Peribacteria bacterium]|nr:hypothetical protein [Candidatus Peribacteria bacterium]
MVLTIRLTFFTQVSSICLTLSLVIAGVNDFHIHCKVSLFQSNHTLIETTVLSLSDNQDNSSLNTLVITSLFKVILFIIVKLFLTILRFTQY